jgi:rhamnose utilization protein RhaD (predicted bifunctional aldolase and dehydrogenase)
MFLLKTMGSFGLNRLKRARLRHLNKNIFVSLDLDNAVRIVLQYDSAKMLVTVLPGFPKGLSPSIETAMRAVIPAKVISHIHSVGAISVGILNDLARYIESVFVFA